MTLWTDMEWFPRHSVKWKKQSAKEYLEYDTLREKYLQENTCASAHLCKGNMRRIKLKPERLVM